MKRRLIPQTPVIKAIVVVILIAVAFNLVVLGIDSVAGAPGGPRGSSFSTSTDGLNAYSELLTVEGYDVRTSREPIGSSVFPPAGTVIVLDPSNITTEETAKLADFTSSGGRLVAGGESPFWVSGLMPDPPTWAPLAVPRSEPLVPLPEVAGVTTIVSEGFGSWVDAGGALPVAGDGDGVIAAIAQIGRGKVVLLADTAPIQNRLLDEADNAAFAVGLAGPIDQPVVFVESVHGYGLATGLSALPVRWKVSGLILILATALLIAAHIRRLGAPEAEGRDLLPPRRVYIDALAATLARTRGQDELTKGMKVEARRLLAARAGMAPDAPAEEMVQAASALGAPSAEARALFGPARSERELLLAGRGLARLGGASGKGAQR